MRTTLYCALSIALGLLLLGQARSQTNPPFTVTISQAQPALHLGSPMMIHIVLKSISQGAFDLPEDRHDGFRGEMNYRTFVTDSRGVPVLDTGLMQKLKNHQVAFGSRSVTFRRLNLGDEVAEDLDLNNVAKLASPGTYVVQVERADDVFGPLHIRSNQLTVHVDEPAGPPASAAPQAENKPPEQNPPAVNETDLQSPQQPFVIRIHANQPQVKVGEPVDINITLSNFSDHVIDCTAKDRLNLDRNYHYEVLNEYGGETPGIELKPSSETFPCTLQPMDSAYFSALLSQIYDFSSPGKYTIQVSRPVESDGQRLGTALDVRDDEALIKSNLITITVLPEDDPSVTQR